MTQPNLFEFATSELSQDAFICWLISWAKPEMASFDSELHEVGKRLLLKFYELAEKKAPDRFEKIEVNKQSKRIDILVTVNGTDKIIIEDKTDTNEHSEQLRRYKDLIVAENPSLENIICIFFKTGEQSNFETVKQDGYCLFLRKDFLNILESGHLVKNSIFVDFYQYLKNLDQHYLSYLTKAPRDWYWGSWQGFYSELKRRHIVDGNWSYVPNPSGGFWGFWWHWRKWHEASHVYLQLENEQLCFKIQVDEQEGRSKLRDACSKTLISLGGGRLVRPAHMGKGKYMTVAHLSCGDYRCSDRDGKLDWIKTLEILKEAEALLNNAACEFRK